MYICMYVCMWTGALRLEVLAELLGHPSWGGWVHEEYVYMYIISPAVEWMNPSNAYVDDTA